MVAIGELSVYGLKVPRLPSTPPPLADGREWSMIDLEGLETMLLHVEATLDNWLRDNRRDEVGNRRLKPSERGGPTVQP
jgi:hypothetical protein